MTVINISDDVYPIAEVLKDLESVQDVIKDLVIIHILKDNTAYVTHTGVSVQNMALACKLLDKEFSNLSCFDNEDTE